MRSRERGAHARVADEVQCIFFLTLHPIHLITGTQACSLYETRTFDVRENQSMKFATKKKAAPKKKATKKKK